MNIKQTNKYNFIFATIVALIIYIAVQPFFKSENTKGLSGYYEAKQKPVFSIDGYLKGAYQPRFESWLKENIGFHDFWVKFSNTIDFFVFKKANANGVIVGKHNTLFEKRYIDSYLGNDFIGEMKIDTTIRSMIFLQQYYKDHGVDILYVFAPGKGAYYKDDIPPKYKNRKTETNYEYFISRCQETQLNLLDYHAIFLNKKDTASKNLYPKYGIHWSSYSLPFVYDTLISRINSFSGNTTEDYSFTFVKDTNFLTNSDYDIIKPMNLLHYPIDKQSVGIRVNDIKDTQKSKRESIFVIGDSFYKTLYKDRVLQKLYHNRGYLYYGRDFYPHNPFGYDKNRSIENFNIMQTSLSSDVIIILGTEANLSLFPFNIQNVIIDSVFSEISDYEKEAYYHRLIDKDIKWENEIKEVASDDNRSYQEVKDSLVVMYIAEGYLDKEGVFRKKKLESIMLTIKNSTVWYEKIKEKAKKKNIPVEEELYLNAIWVYNNQKKK